MITSLNNLGMHVFHAGDGLNDAPVLMQADIVIAVAAGTDIARESAGIVLMKDRIWDVVDVIHLPHKAMRRNLHDLGMGVGA